MKKTNLLLLLLCAAITFSSTKIYAQKAVSVTQHGFKINGDIQGWSDPNIYLIYRVNDSTIKDSALVTNGKFSFTGSVPNPMQAYVLNKSQSRYFQMYLENSVINIVGNTDSLNKIKITGSHTQDDLNALGNAQKGIQNQEQDVYEKYQQAAGNKDSAQMKVCMQQLDSLNDVSDATTKSFIKEHPKSYVSLGQLQSIAYSTNYTDLKSMYDGLDASIKNSQNGQKFAEHLAVLEKVQEGKPALTFTQNDTTGKAVSLSDFKGKYVLVDFWASWCGPCRAENPNVVKAYNKYKDKNFAILGVSLDQDGDKWKKAILHDNLTWSEISDLKGWGNTAAAEYGVQGIPANFLIDPNGTIIGHNLRGEDLESKLASILK